MNKEGFRRYSCSWYSYIKAGVESWISCSYSYIKAACFSYWNMVPSFFRSFFISDRGENPFSLINIWHWTSCFLSFYSLCAYFTSSTL